MLPGDPLDDALTNEAVRYDWFGRRYGWTPEQVDSLPARLDQRLQLVGAVLEEIRDDGERDARRAELAKA